MEKSTKPADLELSEDTGVAQLPYEGPGQPSLPTYKPSWKGYIWDTFDKSPAERHFLFKLDATLLTVACLGVFIRALDQGNIQNAFVSGMKEDLSLYGNELNYMNTCFTVTYAIGQVPTNMILTRVKPHYFLATLEVTWAVLTFAMSSVKNANAIYAIRIFVGLLESGYFPAVMHIAGSWYTKDEMAKRAVIIQSSNAVGPMFSGFLQAAAYTGLNGVAGRAGWRWLFIIDGIITLPIAIASFFCCPDVPANAEPNWLFSAEELAMARRRKPEESYESQGKYTWKQIKGFFTTWHLWMFSLLFSFQGSTNNPNNSMAFWFKGANHPGQPTVFTVPQINLYPTGIQGFQVFFALVSGWLSDTVLRGRRWPPVIFACTLVICVTISLGALPVYGGTPEQFRARWALYYFTTSVTGTTGLMWAWVNETTLGDPGKRAFVGANMNMWCAAFQAFIPIFLFPTWDQPYVVKGNFASAGIAGGALFTALGIAYLDHRDRKAKRGLVERENESSDVVVQDEGSADEKL